MMMARIASAIRAASFGGSIALLLHLIARIPARPSAPAALIK